MSSDGGLGKGQQHTIRKMLDNYVAGVREFSDEKLFAVHQNNLKLRADDLIEITRAELARRGLSAD
jgi:hypothetical protein